MDHGSPPPRPTEGSGAGPNLVYGLIALRDGLIDRETLRAAFRVWVTDKTRPIGQILVDLGAIDAEARARLDELAKAELQAHGDDVQATLSALGTDEVDAFASTLDDPDLRATLSVDSKGDAESTSAWPDAAEGSSGGGRYRKIEELARGGLGIIFRSQDAELNREVALKEILPKRADDPDSRARFLLEAEITGRLEHPGIVAVHSLGTTDGGRPYYVMRFIRGRELKAAIKEFHATDWSSRPKGARTVEFRELLARFVDVCNTVAYAHSRKVIHRDIKPSNILLGPFGETLVIDWGLAKTVDDVGDLSTPAPTIRPALSGGSHPTLDGSAVGTPHYMSPEQANGELDRLGPASDIFLLGSTLYATLTGKAPFEAPTLREALAHARAGTFARPREAVATTPAALEAICLKAMARRTEDRYPGAVALARDVERWLADEPVSAYREPSAERLWRWARHHRAWVRAGAAALLVVATVSVAAALVVDGARRKAVAARVDAEMAEGKAQKAAAEADAQRAMANDNFRKAQDAIDEIVNLADVALATMPGMEGYRAQLAKSARERYDGLLAQRPEDPEVRFAAARVYRLVGNINRGMSRFGLAIEDHRRSLGLLEGLSREFPDDLDYLDRLAETSFDAGDTFRMGGRPADAEALIRKALALADDLNERKPDSLDYRKTRARCLYALATTLIPTDRVHEAVELFDQALAILTPIAGANKGDKLVRIEQAITLCRRGEALREDGRNTQAKASIRDALAKATGLLDDYRGENNCRYVLTAAQTEMGRSLAVDARSRSGALKAFGDAVDGLAALRKDFPLFLAYRRAEALALDDRGALLLDLKRLDPAEADLKAARTILNALRVEAPEGTVYETTIGRNLAHLGRLAVARGDREAARSFFEEAASRHRAALKADPRSRVDDEALKRIAQDLDGLNAPAPPTAGAKPGGGD